MEVVTNKVAIDVELRPELKKAESEFNTFINSVVNRIQTLNSNLTKLGESGKLTSGIRRRATEALETTTESAYGFTRGLDPATIAALGGERAIGTAVGANIARPLREAHSTLRKYESDMDSAIQDTEKAMQRHSRMIPAYLGTVINTVGQAVQMYANLYRAEKLAFDFGSPSGMASALMQYDISRTQLMWGGGGRIAGSVIGGVVGSFWGMPGALAGSYLGSQILGEAGSSIGIFASADKEQRLKMFQQAYGRSASAVQGVMPIESLLYNIIARSGGRINYPTASRLIRSNLDLGITPAQGAQVYEAYSRAGGRTEDFRSFLEFSKAERGTIEGYTALMTPKNQAEQAFMFSAIRNAAPNASLAEIQLMMRSGINDSTVRRAMLEQIGRIPKGMRDYYILAMTEGKGIGAGVTRQMMREFDMGKGAFGAEQILSRALGNVAPGERAEARIAGAQYDLGETIKKSIRDWNVRWEEDMNAFLKLSKTTDLLTGEIENAIADFKKRFGKATQEQEDDAKKAAANKALMESATPEERARIEYLKTHTASRVLGKVGGLWDKFFDLFEESQEFYKNLDKQRQSTTQKVQGGTVKVDTIVTVIPDKGATPDSSKVPMKVAGR